VGLIEAGSARESAPRLRLAADSTLSSQSGRQPASQAWTDKYRVWARDREKEKEREEGKKKKRGVINPLTS
jgi:hypothetical protein